MIFQLSVIACFLLGAFACGSGLLPCGVACYSPSQYCCVNNTLVIISNCASNNSAPDVIILNSCTTDLWIEARMGGAGAPLPGYSTTRFLKSRTSLNYTISNEGAEGTRFWAKYGCDKTGRNCLIGDSMQYWPNPPGGCPIGGCEIPVDSLFEATFGCKNNAICRSGLHTTYFDTSQVDGFTLPYKLTLKGATNKCDCSGSNCPGLTQIDGSHLNLAYCPSNDDASWNNKYPSYNNISMHNLDLRVISNNSIIGCMSPCKKLTYGRPYGYNIPEGSIPAIYMCCPTPNPNNCVISQGCITPDACRAGPITQTQFVQAIHKMAPGIYAYSYDDGVGLHTCPSDFVQYTMEFCPSGSSAYPLPLK